MAKYILVATLFLAIVGGRAYLTIKEHQHKEHQLKEHQQWRAPPTHEPKTWATKGTCGVEFEWPKDEQIGDTVIDPCGNSWYNSTVSR